MKKFFNIKTSYRFEWQDLRLIAAILNVIGIVLFGFAAAYAGLAIAAIGIIKDLTNKDRHLNDILLHLTSVVLNVYFISQI